MSLEQVMNSLVLWSMSSFVVIVILVPSIVFIRQAFKSAETMGIPRSECIAGIRSAMITVIGPALSPIIVLLALMAEVVSPLG